LYEADNQRVGQHRGVRHGMFPAVGIKMAELPNGSKENVQVAKNPYANA
jgi:hypothetical protein